MNHCAQQNHRSQQPVCFFMERNCSMRRFAVLAVALIGVIQSVFALDNGLALTPPMGFNPWNSFANNFNEKQAKEIIEKLISTGLRDAGYIYFNLDAWGGEYKTEPTRAFPSGMIAFGEYVHEKGFKLGVYGNGHHHGEGAYPVGEETKNATMWASWKADYVKYDPWGLPWDHATFTDLRDALAATGRPIVYSIHCKDEESLPDDIVHRANLWRTHGDICRPGKAHFTGYLSVVNNYDANVSFHKRAGPGRWNDPDMLVVGMDSLTENENRAHFSLWCIMSAPLLIGADVRKISQSSIEILKNQEAIAINQDSLGVQGKKVRDEGDRELLVKPLKDGSVGIVMFNRGSTDAEMSFTLEEVGLAHAHEVHIRDIWAHADKGTITSSYSALVESNDVAMLRLFPPDDQSPPTKPSNLTGDSPDITSINLSWSSVTDIESGIIRYNIYRDNQKVGETSQTNYHDTGLSEATAYTYAISATNGRNMEGAKSTPLSVSTKVDSKAPLIYGVSAAGNETQLTIIFDEPIVREGAENPTNYRIDNQVIVSASVLGDDSRNVTLTTSTLVPDIIYTLTVSTITDRAATPNPVASGTTATFQFYPYVQGLLQYRYYEGAWSIVPDFNAMNPVSEGTVDGFTIDAVSNRTDNFGIAFTGMIRIDTPGDYTFFTESDDGSALFVDDVKVVDNNGTHAMKEESGTIALTAGMHPVAVFFFQSGGGKGLRVAWQPPGRSKEEVPTEVLYATDTGNPTVFDGSYDGRLLHPVSFSARIVNNRIVVTGLNPVKEYNLVLADLQGRVVETKRIAGLCSYHFDRHTFPSGVFIVKLGQNRESRTMIIATP